MGSEDKFLEALRASKAFTVLDRLYQQDHRACAWIIEGSTSTNRISGSMITPGTAGDHSSFRSKAAGVYGLLLTVWYCLSSTFKLPGALTVACNGKSVLDWLCTHKIIDPFAEHSELLCASWNLLVRIQCHVSLMIKVTQLYFCVRHGSILRWIILQKAGLTSPTAPQQHHLSHSNHDTCWLIQKIVKNHKTALCIAFNKPATKQYWDHKINEPEHDFGHSGHHSNGKSTQGKHTSMMALGIQADHQPICAGKTWCNKVKGQQLLAHDAKHLLKTNNIFYDAQPRMPDYNGLRACPSSETGLENKAWNPTSGSC